MQKPSALCVINPVAGKGAAPSGLQARIAATIGQSHDISFFVTSAQGDALRAVTESAPGLSLLICCGGDGTFNEVVSGILQAKLRMPVLYVPLGTANDIARSLYISNDLGSSAALLAKNRLTAMDAGLFNKKAYFMYTAAFGAFTEVAYSASQSFKNRFGYFAYLSYFFKGLFQVRRHRCNCCVDGEETSGAYIFGSITNSLSVGGIIKFDNGVVFDDGEFELLLIEYPKTFLLIPWVALKLLLKKYNTKWITLKKCKTVRMKFDKPVAWTVDGEYAGTITEASVDIIPACYQVYGNADLQNIKS